MIILINYGPIELRQLRRIGFRGVAISWSTGRHHGVALVSGRNKMARAKKPNLWLCDCSAQTNCEYTVHFRSFIGTGTSLKNTDDVERFYKTTKAKLDRTLHQQIYNETIGFVFIDANKSIVYQSIVPLMVILWTTDCLLTRFQES